MSIKESPQTFKSNRAELAVKSCGIRLVVATWPLSLVVGVRLKFAIITTSPDADQGLIQGGGVGGCGN